jgi:hypothetical protein
MILFYYSCRQNFLFCVQWVIAFLWSWFLACATQIILWNSSNDCRLHAADLRDVIFLIRQYTNFVNWEFCIFSR